MYEQLNATITHAKQETELSCARARVCVCACVLYCLSRYPFLDSKLPGSVLLVML
jgi:hypothetical protein